ncbi:hypothetical protein [Rhizobium lentis]|uniref:hypothetical protein n=1 Tax=Rhizobium lentis TaxID=1138194 RepID=UPI001C839788|nr:hypothetical protein [Rhizobium lentis]MBX5014957.1 hypothetical protein [Rhizobium lentis]
MLHKSQDFHSRFPNFGFDKLSRGIECDDGWLPILTDFCVSVGSVMDGGRFKIVQVKEKFGAMQIYFKLSDAGSKTESAVSDARQLASHRSLHVCEVCGRRGRLTNIEGMYKTVCEDHANTEMGAGVPVDLPDDITSDSPYDAAVDPFVKVRPTAHEFHGAPLLVGWALADEGLPWIHAWFFDHPEIEDGTHGHTSPLVALDDVNPPCWARTDSRLYRLGVHYGPAEREIRYWTQKHLGTPVQRGTAPGGDADVETMLGFLRTVGRLRRTTVDRLEQAYQTELQPPGPASQGRS